MNRCLIYVLWLFPIAASAHKKDTCYTGLYLKNVYDMQPEAYAYSADFWLWFNYGNKNFNPLSNVELVNAKQISLSDPYFTGAGRGQRLASESAKVTMTHDWKLKNYPFDRQLLEIRLEAGLDTSKMLLKPASGNFKYYKGLSIPGWEIFSHKTIESTVHYDSDFGENKLNGNSYFSRITYQLEIRRNSWGLFFKLLIGLYISFFVAYLVFFVPPARDQRFGLSIGGLFAAVGNKYVMDSNIPSTISFSFVDKIHDLTFLFILATLVLSVISLRLTEGNRLDKAKKFDRVSAWIVLGSYFAMNGVLIAQAVYF